MVEVTARCHPALESMLPKPMRAAECLPGWLKDMPAEVAAETLGGAPVRTLKHCPPLIDALSLGLMVPLAADLTFRGGEIHWDWDPPHISDQLFTRAPIGLHVPEQAAGAPLPIGENFVLKFTNFWTFEVPQGWSILFTHPLNSEDLPFRSLAGLVQCDRFADGFVHFPAIWTDPAFEGVLPAGTPVAQAIPLPREALSFETGTFDPAQATRVRETQESLQEMPGHYRRLRRGAD